MLSIFSRRFLHGCSILGQQIVGRSCLLCGARVVGAGLCPGCDSDLPRLAQARCPQCALPSPGGAVCGACLADPPFHAHACAVFSYAFPLDALVHALKYTGDLAAVEPLAAHLAEAAAGAPRPDLIVPMPLAPERLRERGFNQSVEIGRAVAGRLGIPLVPDLARRIRHTAPQVSLPWKERAKNIRGAFACGSDLRGKHVAILDDVMTTGATIDELAKTLRKAGALEVSAWVVARTLRRDDPQAE